MTIFSFRLAGVCILSGCLCVDGKCVYVWMASVCVCMAGVCTCRLCVRVDGKCVYAYLVCAPSHIHTYTYDTTHAHTNDNDGDGRSEEAYEHHPIYYMPFTECTITLFYIHFTTGRRRRGGDEAHEHHPFRQHG
jgi:hypothetical protein